MQVRNKVVIVTGGASGIGPSLCRRFAAEGAKTVVVADDEREAGRKLAAEIEGWDVTTNVGSESDVQMLVDSVLKKHGRIDLFCSNSAVVVEGDCSAPDRDWLRSWEMSVMSHVYAARAVLPSMLARQEGYLMQIISAAGMPRLLDSAPYAVTKHAALGLAEWLSITYGNQGIKVSVLDQVVGPGEVGEVVIRGLDAEKFLIAGTAH